MTEKQFKQITGALCGIPIALIGQLLFLSFIAINTAGAASTDGFV